MVTVTYATAGGTATSGSDFWPRFGALSFAPGTTTRTVAVPVVADRRDEPDETYSLVLSSPLDATLADDTGIGTNLDDDAVPALSIRGARRREGRTGTRDMLFPVRLSTFSGRTVLVDYTTSNGTASAGSDYVFTSGTLTFPQGTLQQVIHVPIFGDTVGEANETLFVTLSGAVDATLAVPQATGRILDDDGVR
jgi:chitinase